MYDAVCKIGRYSSVCAAILYWVSHFDDHDNGLYAAVVCVVTIIMTNCHFTYWYQALKRHMNFLIL